MNTTAPVVRKQLSKEAEVLLRNAIRKATAPTQGIRSGRWAPPTQPIGHHPLVYIAKGPEVIGLYAYTGRWGVHSGDDLAYGWGTLSGFEIYLSHTTKAKGDEAYAELAEILERTEYPADMIINAVNKWMGTGTARN